MPPPAVAGPPGGLHNLAPAGIIPCPAADGAPRQQESGALHWLGGTRIALGTLPVTAAQDARAAAAPWGEAGAILDVAAVPRPELAASAAAAHGALRAPDCANGHCDLARTPGVVLYAACMHQRDLAAEAWSTGILLLGTGAAANGPSSAAANGPTGPELNGAAPPAAAPTGALAQHYLSQPIVSSKFDRGALQRALPAALRYIGGHLRAGRTVAVHGDPGLDAASCAAVAALLTHFRTQVDAGASEEWRLRPDARSAAANGGGGCGSGGEGNSADSPPLPVEAVSKPDIQRCLAFVSGHFPAARPTRGMLKQVFNHFQEVGGRTRKPAATQ